MKKHPFALILIIFVSTLLGCNKKDPHPELKDDIFNDLVVELGIASKSLDSELKVLANLQKELDAAVPQTGQIKFATKKVRTSEELINTLKQRKIYFEIKVEQRRLYVQDRYDESFRSGGRAWPDAKEIELYRAITKLNREKLAYDKNKRMVKDVPRGTKVVPSSEQKSSN